MVVTFATKGARVTTEAVHDLAASAIGRYPDGGGGVWLPPGSEGIGESWRRSALCGVARTDPAPWIKESFSDLPAGIRKHAIPTASEVLSILGPVEVALVTTTSRGKVVHVAAPSTWLVRRLSRLGVTPGVDWSEELVGTSAFGLALEEKRVAHVGRGEHYLTALRTLCAAAVPVTHPRHGRVLGAVAAVALNNVEPGMLAGLATLMATKIQQRIDSDDADPDRRLIEAFLRETRRRDTAVLARSDRLEIANSAAASLLGRADRALMTRHGGLASGAGADKGMVHVTLSDHTSVAAKIRSVGRPGDEGGVLVTLSTRGSKAEVAEQSEDALGFAVGFVGRSRSAAHVRSLANRAVGLGAPLVVVRGERGVGKTLLAHLIADRLAGPAGSVRLVDAGAVSAADLVGLVRTGPDDQPVVVEHADDLVATELAVLTETVMTRSGPPVVLTWVDRDRSALPADLTGAFEIRVPPLRERAEDVLDLVSHLAARGEGARVAGAILEALVNHDWPGNVGELRELMQSLARQTRGRQPTLADLPRMIAGRRLSLGRMEHIERNAILQALQENDSNKSQAAAALGIGRATLYRKLRAYRITPDEERVHRNSLSGAADTCTVDGRESVRA